MAVPSTLAAPPARVSHRKWLLISAAAAVLCVVAVLAAFQNPSAQRTTLFENAIIDENNIDYDKEANKGKASWELWTPEKTRKKLAELLRKTKDMEAVVAEVATESQQAVEKRGPTGAPGAAGGVGQPGRAGQAGKQGPAGADGPTGDAGIAGVVGAPGAQGPVGDDGLVGPTGPQGVRGNVGPVGLAGPPGPVGAVGAVGPHGAPAPPPPPPPPTYILDGTVINAVNGAAVGSSVIRVLDSVNQTLLIVSTNADSGGHWSVRVPAGTYIVQAIISGYMTLARQVVLGAANQDLVLGLSPTLPAGQMRVVVNWGATPRDADSYLRVAGGCTVYYGQPACGVDATLDHDVTSGYGPETITILRRVPGSYEYMVKNYSGDASLRGSATVALYTAGTAAPRLFSCGVDGILTGSGRSEVWSVFVMDGATGAISLATS